MERILFPTDFSETTEHALQYAVYLAKLTGARLYFVNAFELEFIFPDIPVESYAMEEDISDRRLNELKDRVQKEQEEELDIVTIASLGDTIKSVRDIVKRDHIDMVVMGTRGASGIREFFSASHTFRVVKNVDCPVLVIPENWTFKELRSIAFATDLTHLPEKHIEKVKALAKATSADMKIVHVDRTGESSAEEKRERSWINDYLGDDVPHSFEVIREEEVLKGLEEYLDDHPEIGMLTMVSHERRDWLEKLVSPRLTKEVVHHPHLPTLIIHH